MQTNIDKQTAGLYTAGLVMLAVSFILFCIPFFYQPGVPGFFMGQFCMAALYFSVLLSSGRLKKGRMGLQPMFLFLLLFLVSAYSLNREMSVFEPSTDWFSVLLFIIGINYIAFNFLERLPGWLQYVSCFIGGVALVTFLYLALYLFPIYIAGIIGAIFLGFSLHVFVPLLFFIYTLFFFGRLKSLSPGYISWFRRGIVGSVVLVIVFTITWSQRVYRINEAIKTGSEYLPSWVNAAQKMQPGFIDNRICKAGLVYDVPGDIWSNIFWSMPNRGFDEPMKHDPLVFIASLIGGKSNLVTNDRISILKAMYHSRHQAEERLWTGENLSTAFVFNNVEVWPQFRIAYSELKIKVENSPAANSWNRQQEAIYTFHLPEGSVVTSLSLWINGVEEKGMLTTRSKADNAYKTIVGREVRDPSVVHWQEGNRVSVRVFPVETGKNREFKIGITSPLLLQDSRLLYQPVYFNGPSVYDAKEETNIRFRQKPKNFQSSDAFDETSETIYTRKGRYKSGWYIAFDKSEVTADSFLFNGKSYTASTAGPERESFSVNTVYLDVNGAWSQKECIKVYNVVKRKKVFVWDDKEEWQELNEKNISRVFEELRRNTFSLFPFSKIKDPARALVITRSNTSSPLLDDIKDSGFGSEMRQYLAVGNKTHVFNIGATVSPYLKSLKEVQAFRYAQGDIALLDELLKTQRYPAAGQKADEILLDTAGIIIRQREGGRQSSAPDHLMRLFVYNNILRKYGAAILSGEEIESEAIKEAEEAYVVSPVSSLVVLETQRDYERFNIESSKDSLKNASLASKGAVPEPHEWAMILVAVSLLIYVRRQSFKHSFKN